MFKVKVEVLQAVGSIKSGFGKKDGKPYAIGEQDVAVHIDGKPYPVCGTVPVKTENLKVDNGIITCNPVWLTPGFYEGVIVVESGRFGGIEAKLLDRALKPIKPAEVRKAA